jgi:histidinol-phosphate aminotransferase
MQRLFKDHLLKLKRYQTSRNRDLEGLRLDRNERVSPHSIAVLHNMFSRFTPDALAAHPESDTIYDSISEFIGLSRDHIYVTDGITEGVRQLFQSLTTPRDAIVVLDPTYPMYGVYANMFDLEYRPFAYGSDLAPDWKTLDAALDARVALVVIANPNLPVESVFSRAQVRDIAERCRATGSALVIDEAYHHFGAESVIDLVDEIDNLIVFRTFSKAFGLASIRLGYMVSSPRNIKYLSKTRSMIESNTLSHGIGCYMLEHIEIMQANVRDVKEGAAYLQEELSRMGLRWHGGNCTNGLLIFLDRDGDPDDLISFLKDRRIYIRGAFHPPYHRSVRISIGSVNAMRQFVDGLKAWLVARVPGVAPPPTSHQSKKGAQS